MTKGSNLYNSLYEQDLSIFAHSDPEITNRPNSHKTHRTKPRAIFGHAQPGLEMKKALMNVDVVV
ncbi:hypothetical protein ES703_54100 [subsurface metagenome]